MKKCVSLLLALAVSTTMLAAAIHPPRHAADMLIPMGNGQFISLQELASIKVTDYEKLAAKKMKLIDRVGFKIAQRKLRHMIEPDGTVTSKALLKAYGNEMVQDGGGFHLGGFALGFLLGLLGVLIAYIINDEKNRSRRKWSWIGAALAVVLYILLVI